MTSLYLLPVLALCLISTTSANVLAPYYEVHVVNALPYEAQFLQVHCASKDDDIGYHEIYLGEEIHWRFRVDAFICIYNVETPDDRRIFLEK
ncbi:hypothetical protein RJ640_021045 [Escallonia rubra]|uniref:S-protein homolog n=1 Tax=Escallonia rubra TaxID=112253 RepID=A0AA88R5Y6_9ASTE|nr:hypothetical protein RJ640_021045 [Escallonia rubra]